MNTLWLVIGVVGLFTIAYRYYSGFIAAKVLVLDERRLTPAHRLYDGHNYYPTNKYVLFGHHFAAITGAGPLIGPVLAAQFGYLPGLLWLVIGVVIGGAVHDFVTLFASVRHDGKSLAEIARKEVNPVAGVTTAVAILFIVVIALAGLGLAVVNALRESAWGTFTIATTIPLALMMGLYMYRFRKGRIWEATAIGVAGLILAVIFGKQIPASFLGPWFTLTKNQITFALAAYGLLASILPVWMLLCPRDYLSSFMKIGTIAFLALGVAVIHPDLKMPALTEFVRGGGPIIPGKLFPFVFITIACGAISGFHSLIGSGTTPKMISSERDIRPIGYGAMLIESFVGFTSLVAAASLFPGDYFAINTTPEAFRSLGYSVVNLPEFSREVGEVLQGRTGGAVSLAVGMAQIFSGLPGMKQLVGYWYHFAIMFEALFILTTIDTGTRVARFLVQEFLGKFYKPFERTDWWPGTVLSSLLIVSSWAYFIYTGSISTIWPMFGIANQLLAGIALCVGTTFLVNHGKAKYMWVTAAPLAFLSVSTLTAGWLSIRDNFVPMTKDPALAFQGWLNSALTVIMMACVVIILVNSIWKWYSVLLRPQTRPQTAEASSS
ncbi:MAG: carbon starvation protein A [Acidobacteria bacterium]|nr:carbon starvation protein A [Acidobacteriota bacterium]